ncbi:MAG TPA: hypothetical protein VFA77_07965, partial [Candidatus Eisenbacteria bacterium]|nr:hypothetical protein [Candidatus Eisenbacteria bacterium]
IKSQFIPQLLLLMLVVCSLPAQTPLVNHSDSWRYRKGTSAPQANWKTAADASLDGSWPTGNGGFGYADNTTETSLCQTILSDMRNGYSTVAMRKSFQVSSNLDASLHLWLTMDWDDGFISWLDGVYLTSENSPGAPVEPAYNADATASHESSRGDSSRQPAVIYDLGAVGSRLPIGTHVLSIIGLNNSLGGSSDFVQIADLFLMTNNPNCLSGPISVDTTWRATNSPIVICGNVTIDSGVTLIIEPGTTVQLDSGLGINIANGGRLLAEGTASAPILFTRSPTAANWGHITINGAAGSPETRIAYAHFEFNANNTGTPCIEVAAGTAYLDHLTFANNNAPYIHVDGASFVISDCEFPSGAAEFELVHGTGGIKSGGHGIFLRNFFGSTIGYSDVVDFTGGNRPSPIVHFIDNVFSGSQDDGVDLDGTDAWVEGNIFMHVHRNGDTPDSSSAISGGNDSGLTSEVTIIGNLIFDCDNAATAKQGNFFTLMNNTIIHTTRTGGIDGDSGVVTVRDTTPSLTTFARGFYLEGNIIWDAGQLVRNYDASQTMVTFNNNILPLDWTGPGAGNSVTNPMLNHIPQLSETVFTNWAQAQIVRTWFGLQAGSPGIGTGPNGRDKGGVIPLGVSISGEPGSLTTLSNATLTVGVVRTGFGMPTTGWPDGAGYTHYKWRLDTNAWSAETPIATPINLTGLANGPHYVEVTGKRDSGLYQDDPLFGLVAGTTRSRTWTVGEAFKIDSISVTASNTVEIQFVAQANIGYTIQYRAGFSAGAWQPLAHLDPIPSVHNVVFPDSPGPDVPMRFYRLSSP